MKKKALVGALILLVAYLFGVNLSDLKSIQKSFFPSPTPTLSPSQISTSRVLSVIDGDTIVIDGDVKVRYVGIDAPEVDECFSDQSREINKQLVEGKIIRLEKDVSDKDKYGRLLRYVYVYPSTGSGQAIFVNDYLIRDGFAKVMAIKPDLKYYEQLKESQTEAKEFNRGLWSFCSSIPKPNQ